MKPSSRRRTSPGAAGSSMTLVVVLAAACTDPPPPPPPVNEPPAPLTVRTIDEEGLPVAGVTLFSHDADWQPIDQQVSGVTGETTVDVARGGAITTHVGELPEGDWFTILAVEPGDHLTVIVREGNGGGALHVTLSVPPLPAGATRYQASGPCAAAWASNDVPQTTLWKWIDPRCPDRGPMVVTAYDEDGSTIAYLEAADVALDRDVTLAGPWLPPSTTFDVEVTGFPPGGGTVAVDRRSTAGGVPFGGVGATLETTTAVAAATLQRPDLGGDGVAYHLQTREPDGACIHRERTLTRALAADVDPFETDLKALLPPITSIAFDEHVVSWTGGGGGDTVGYRVELWATPRAGNGGTRIWRIMAPPGTQTIHLPTDVGFQWPGVVPQVMPWWASVREIGSTYWTGYRELRQVPGSLYEWAEYEPMPMDRELVHRTSRMSRRYYNDDCAP